MAESLPGGPKILTHAELDAAVQSLWNVGGAYEYIAGWVERDNRPHCVGERGDHVEFRPETSETVES